MRTAAPALLPMFRSDSQVEMLGLLLLQPERSWTLGELATHVRSPASSVHRELHRAIEAGILTRDETRRPHRYQAATKSPVYQPLRDLLERTVGVPGRLRRALSDIDGVRVAAIHGSWAAARVRPDSDIDVVIVTDGDRRSALRAARLVGRQVGRDVDAVVITAKDFDEMRRSADPFIERIHDGARINVVGNFDALYATP